HGMEAVPEGETTYDRHIRRSRVSGSRTVKDDAGNEHELESAVAVVQNGAGQKWVRFTGFMEYLLQVLVTPIDDAQVEVRFIYMHRAYAEDSFEYQGIQGAIESTNGQRGLEGDMPIWHNKFHLRNPVLCDGDGPIMRFRKYFAQFYVGGPYPGEDGVPSGLQEVF
ncbi:MAG: Rieske (2Fe-2S) protein, partial [Halioglobus sp.]|nr:Rieske (2Fe-2S) protein [Halioglobus sp.]